MSIEAIKKYREQVEKAEKQGKANEQNIREYFYELLKAYTSNAKIEIDREQRERGNKDNNIYFDGRILKEGIPVGHIENKDARDDLKKEIEGKLDKGYTTGNTIFENSKIFILYQNGVIALQVDVSDEKRLNELLIKFVNFESNSYKDFKDGLYNLKQTLPRLSNDLKNIFEVEKKENKKFSESLDNFTNMCKTSINSNVHENDAIEIIIQHLLTKDIFIAVFDSADFHDNNIISSSIKDILGSIKNKTREINEKIRECLKLIKRYIATITESDRQSILKVFYENFYKALNEQKADKLGVVYTPLEIVRFMVSATDNLLYYHFNKYLSSKNVNILDPCTGTGIFTTEVMEKISKDDLEYKYKNEIFANEIDIMPYYIANLNIENEYFNRMKKYETFENMCLVDTLEFSIKSGKKDETDDIFKNQYHIENLSIDNVERVKKQYKKEISIVIGNPPYNANQKSENQNNKNKVYDTLDKRIKATYIAESKAQALQKQYDPYKRFIRWASDRIKKDGIIAFITNNAYIDSKQDDGFRKCIQEEFDYVYIIDLKGNARKKDKREGQNVFNIQVGTAIMFLIKIDGVKNKKAEINYISVEDFANRQRKFEFLSKRVRELNFKKITPTEKGQWINQTDNDFDSLIPLISKEVKNAKEDSTTRLEIDKKGKKKTKEYNAIFKLFSLGVGTNRDNWAYDLDKKQLEEKVKYFTKVYNRVVDKWKPYFDNDNKKNEKTNDFYFKENLNYTIKWSSTLIEKLINRVKEKYNNKNIRTCMYRPFFKTNFYFSPLIIHRIFKTEKIYPNENSKNIALSYDIRAMHGSLATNCPVDLHFNGDSSVVPLYRYENEKKILNITEYGLKIFKDKYGSEITPEDIFAYCHAVLSSPRYQKKYEDNLKTDYPRIPLYDDFKKYVNAGKRLIELQTNYENIKPIKLTIKKDNKYMPDGINEPNKNKVFPIIKVDKKLGKIILDSKNSIEDIPLIAFDYKIGTRSAIEWVCEYYKPRKLNPEKELHHKTLIKEGLDNYDWKSIRENLFDLIPKIATVSIETLEIFSEL